MNIDLLLFSGTYGCFEKYCYNQAEEETSQKRSKKRILLLRAFAPRIEHLRYAIHSVIYIRIFLGIR